MVAAGRGPYAPAMPNQDKLVEGARPLLDNEEIVGALIASPKGLQTAMAGGIAGEIGGAKVRKVRRSAEDAGLVVKAFNALVVTPTRLATVGRDRRGRVTELLSAVPLTAVEGMEIKRFGLGGRLTIAVSDVEVKLECRVGDGRTFVEAFERARSLTPASPA
jgi:hypothetical protein